mmetsp:Transcript_2104/g.6024  ORF Transcript_2104/g.6024 Transcript_2104/m.6024 type:complete len:386 (-) Transcript_2104:34-1191(-)
MDDCSIPCAAVVSDFLAHEQGDSRKRSLSGGEDLPSWSMPCLSLDTLLLGKYQEKESTELHTGIFSRSTSAASPRMVDGMHETFTYKLSNHVGDLINEMPAVCVECGPESDFSNHDLLNATLGRGSCPAKLYYRVDEGNHSTHASDLRDEGGHHCTQTGEHIDDGGLDSEGGCPTSFSTVHQYARQPLNVLHDELLRTRKSLACERPDFLSLSSSYMRGGTVDCTSAGNDVDTDMAVEKGRTSRRSSRSSRGMGTKSFFGRGSRGDINSRRHCHMNCGEWLLSESPVIKRSRYLGCLRARWAVLTLTHLYIFRKQEDVNSRSTSTDCVAIPNINALTLRGCELQVRTTTDRTSVWLRFQDAGRARRWTDLIRSCVEERGGRALTR